MVRPKTRSSRGWRGCCIVCTRVLTREAERAPLVNAAADGEDEDEDDNDDATPLLVLVLVLPGSESESESDPESSAEPVSDDSDDCEDQSFREDEEALALFRRW